MLRFFKFCSPLVLPHHESYHLYLFLLPTQLLHVVDFAYFYPFHAEFRPTGKVSLFLICKRQVIQSHVRVTDAPSLPLGCFPFTFLLITPRITDFCGYHGSQPSSARRVLCKTDPICKSYDLQWWEPGA